MLMRLGDSGDTATKSKEYWWKQRINNNPFSLEETFALMHGVTVEEMHHAKDRISKMASYIINNQGSASGIDRWLDLTESDLAMLAKMYERGDSLAIAVLDAVRTSSPVARLNKDMIEALIKSNLPLEFLSVSDTSYPDSVYESAVSVQTRILLALPNLVKSQVEGLLERSLDAPLELLYQLTYFARLSETNRIATTKELSDLGYQLLQNGSMRTRKPIWMKQ